MITHKMKNGKGKRGFQPGNQLWQKANEARELKRTAWETIVGYLAGEGGDSFKAKLAELSNKTELTKPEQQFMDYYLQLLEYHQPKLARSEITGKDGASLAPQIVTINLFNGEGAKHQLSSGVRNVVEAEEV